MSFHFMAGECEGLAEFAASSGASAVTSPVYSGNYAIQISSGAGNKAYNDDIYPGNSEVWLSFAFRYSATPTNNKQIAAIKYGAGTYLAQVFLYTDESLRVSALGGSFQTGSTTLSPNTWYKLDLRCKQGTGSNGQAELRLNGVQEAYSSNGTNTSAPGGMEFSNDASGATFYFDDGRFATQSESWPTWNYRIISLRPESDNSTYDQWLPASNNYSYVDDYPLNDSSEADSNGGANRQYWDLPTQSLSAVDAAVVGARVRDEGGFAGPARLVAYNSNQTASENSGDLTASLLTSHSYFQYTMSGSARPSSQADVDDYVVGVYSEDTKKSMYCSEAYLMLSYVPVAEGGPPRGILKSIPRIEPIISALGR